MSLETLKQHGNFSWNELATTDVAAAKAFYREALGWEMEDMKTSCGEYTMVKMDGREVAGIMVLPEDAKGMPPTWGSYVTVDDVDARVKRIESLGGKLCMGPQDIPDIGRFAIITDPQGAMLALITYFNKE